MKKLFCLILPVFVFYIPKTAAQEWEQVCHFTPTTSPVYELFADSIDNLLYIGGTFDSINGGLLGNMGYYDGTNFHTLIGRVNAISNGGLTGVYTMGRFKDEIYVSAVRSVVDTPLIAGIGYWNGIDWNPCLGGVYFLDGDYAFPSRVHDFYVTQDTLYMAGYLDLVDGIETYGVTAWDGEKWIYFNMPNDVSNGAVLATSVSLHRGYMYVGGNFIIDIGGVEYHDILRYKDGVWRPVGNGFTSAWANLSDLEVFKDRVYMAGHFTEAGGDPGNCIASWDGTKWDNLGGGLCSFGWINKMVVHKGKLYVTGRFDCIGGIEAHNVATWDGERWCSVGNSVFDYDPKTIAVWNDTVYVGGNFDEVGGFPVRKLARFVGDNANQACSEPVPAREPGAEGAGFHLQNSLSGTEVTVYQAEGGPKAEQILLVDALGRVVRRQPFRRNMEVVQVHDLPSGVYFLQITGQGRRLFSGKVLVQH